MTAPVGRGLVAAALSAGAHTASPFPAAVSWSAHNGSAVLAPPTVTMLRVLTSSALAPVTSATVRNKLDIM
ncbi:MAG: hypothetical protein R3E93_10290 [Thiothrix sp.]